jgi:hypothetical protein
MPEFLSGGVPSIDDALPLRRRQQPATQHQQPEAKLQQQHQLQHQPTESINESTSNKHIIPIPLLSLPLPSASTEQPRAKMAWSSHSPSQPLIHPSTDSHETPSSSKSSGTQPQPKIVEIADTGNNHSGNGNHGSRVGNNVDGMHQGSSRGVVASSSWPSLSLGKPMTPLKAYQTPVAVPSSSSSPVQPPSHQLDASNSKRSPHVSSSSPSIEVFDGASTWLHADEIASSAAAALLEEQRLQFRSQAPASTMTDAPKLISPTPAHVMPGVSSNNGSSSNSASLSLSPSKGEAKRGGGSSSSSTTISARNTNDGATQLPKSPQRPTTADQERKVQQQRGHGVSSPSRKRPAITKVVIAQSSPLIMILLI